MHGVPGGPQLVGERADAGGQPLGVVEQQDLGHAAPPDVRNRVSLNRFVTAAGTTSWLGLPYAEAPMDLTDRLRALADVLPMLEAPDADFGHWELPPPRDGVHSLGWFEFGPTAEAWRNAVAQGAWIVGGFDWSSWLAATKVAPCVTIPRRSRTPRPTSSRSS